MSSLNPTANEVVGEIGNIARGAREGLAAGARSGYNQMKAGGWSNLFGMGHLKNIKAINQKTAQKSMNIIDFWGGPEKIAAMGADDPMRAAAGKELLDAGVEGLKGMGNEALGFVTGHGYTGFGRAGAIGARSAMLYGAVQAADFLNPFGFGSVRD